MDIHERGVADSEDPVEDFISDLLEVRESLIWLSDPDSEVLSDFRGIVGIGIDGYFVESAEVFLHKPRFAESIFTPEELEYCRRPCEFQDPPLCLQRFASHFAGKEAVAKALGGLPGGIHSNWKDIEIRRNKKRKPYPALHGDALELAREIGVSHLYLSLTHLAGIVTSGGTRTPSIAFARCIAFSENIDSPENLVNRITS